MTALEALCALAVAVKTSRPISKKAHQHERTGMRKF
jgi:hypothetical protein